MAANRSRSASGAVQLEGVSANQGVLSFQSLAAFERTYPTISQMDVTQAAAWERDIGFVSQRNIFNQIVEAEDGFLWKPYEYKSDKELKKIAPPQGHTAIYQRYLRAGVIKRQPDDDTYDYALSDRSYAPIVNADGFFIVADTLYQVKGGLFKEVEGADLSRRSSLDRARSTDSAKKITVRPTIDLSGEAAAKAGLAGCSFPRSSGWITSGNRRGSTTVYFSLNYVYPFPYKHVIITYNVAVTSQKKNFWGTWIYPSCPNECWIGGTWTANFDYISAQTLGFAGTMPYARSYSYPHPNCINMFQASINPATGTTAPYPSTFTFNAPAGLAFSNVRLSPMQWSVSVPGGSSGLNCSVSCP